MQITFPLATVAAVGLISPGMRVILGTVGAPPARVFHRIPERGALQLGHAGSAELDAATLSRMAKVRFDLNADRKDDLYYLDTNGNGQIDALAYDRNGDGRIGFLQFEGPNAFAGTGGTLQEFDTVERTIREKQLRFLVRNGQVAYLIVAEDKNADGDVADEGEFEGSFAELQ